MEHPRTDLKNSGPRSVLGCFAAFAFLCTPAFASAQVLINEVQIAGAGERFIELYNVGASDVDMTDWYIQRKTATGSSFNSLVTSTKFSGKSIKANSYFLISRGQLANSDIVAPYLMLTESNTLRIREAKGNDVDEVSWTSITDGKSYQRTSTGTWVVATPTPGTATVEGVAPSATATTSPDTPPTAQDTPTEGAAFTSNNVSHFPVEPQIFTKVTAQSQTIPVGAPVIFTGRVWGLKKEPIENARMMWAFGDGARGEGQSVAHTYYYPGEYTVIVDAASGYYAASDRVRIIVVVPALALKTGGDETRSFVTIENKGDTELDLSEWQVVANEKMFIIPKNTVLVAHKILTLASEVTGLVTPAGSVASLRFPNGSVVPLATEPIVVALTKSAVASETLSRGSVKRISVQTASALDALPEPLQGNTSPASDTSWAWYSGAAFFGIFAALGLRFARGATAEFQPFTADDFEIIDEDEDKKDDLF